MSRAIGTSSAWGRWFPAATRVAWDGLIPDGRSRAWLARRRRSSSRVCSLGKIKVDFCTAGTLHGYSNDSGIDVVTPRGPRPRRRLPIRVAAFLLLEEQWENRS
ncbi:hypothetical protein HMPREF1868_00858 [Olsenella sp. DNF00959]|nr:hypothetical protein HMPREF1868_00858 [Olsenella sp. DNF00959]